VELLTEYGQAMDEEGNPTGPRGRYGQSKAPGAMRCPECGHVSPNRSALQSHVRGQHNTSLAKLLGEKTLTCPECGQDCAKPQGLAAHRRTAHGITPNGGEDDQPTLLEDAKPAARKKAAGRPRKKSA
jgi:uncharacterized C2H2 Zn-finger protein